MNRNADLIIYTDGGARGNPGPAAFGFVIYNQDNELVFEQGQCIGIQTNNFAEYTALIRALETAKNLGGKTIFVYMDSELIVKQMKGEYKIKQPQLRLLANQVLSLIKNFISVEFKHIPRKQNKEADRMVNVALDGKI